MNQDRFEPFALDSGSTVGAFDTYRMAVPGNGRPMTLESDATHILLAASGQATVQSGYGRLALTAGMFCVLPCAAEATGDWTGLVISQPSYLGLFQLGGPLEDTGRLRYIDGCTDTLLVCPPRLGEPCLNHLHIPPDTAQTQHTHPSDRVGIIVRGRGKCITPTGHWDLFPGMGWRIPSGCRHSFHTDESLLDVIAWHPDSDFGPTDENHPMRNKTLLNR